MHPVNSDIWRAGKKANSSFACSMTLGQDGCFHNSYPGFIEARFRAIRAWVTTICLLFLSLTDTIQPELMMTSVLSITLFFYRTNSSQFFVYMSRPVKCIPLCFQITSSIQNQVSIVNYCSSISLSFFCLFFFFYRNYIPFLSVPTFMFAGMKN